MRQIRNNQRLADNSCRKTGLNEESVMRKATAYLLLFLLLNAPALWSQSATIPTSSSSDTNELRQELEQLKKTVAALEAKLAAQDKQTAAATETVAPATEPTVAVKELDDRVTKTEKRS